MSRFDATKGGFWLGQLPDGQHAVFWSHPSLGEWHRQIAAFPSKERAEAYLVNEAQTLTPAFAPKDLTEPAPPEAEERYCELRTRTPEMHARVAQAMRNLGAEEDDKGVLTLKNLRVRADDPAWDPDPEPIEASHSRTPEPSRLPSPDQMLADLKEMFELLPDGITSQHFMERYRLPYNDALASLRWLHDNGHAQWVYKGGRPGAGKVLLPPNVKYTENDLSVRQEKVLQALIEGAHEGVVSMTFVEISHIAGVSFNGMGAHLWALEKKGYIRLAQPYDKSRGKPAVYRILKRRAKTWVSKGEPVET